MRIKKVRGRFLSVLFLLFCIHLSLSAQMAIKGVVFDSSNEPIIGANILEKGTTNGVISDMDGKFNLSVKSGSELVVSYVGYISQTIKATSNMKITLQEDTKLIDEVVVVGYGTTKRKNFTGSVSILKTDEGGVALTAPTNAVDMLRGLSPGLSMTQSGVAGSLPNLQIRGRNPSVAEVIR